MDWAFRILRPIANLLLPSQPMTVRVLSGPAHGARLLIEPRTEKYYWRGRHEPAVAEAMARLLKPGDVFWDIGAHIGYFSLIGARCVGPIGQVHAFEPLPANVRRLRSNIALNRTTNITVHEVALDEHAGQAFLHSAESTLMWSLLGGSDTGLKVRCTTLDALLEEVGPPNLVKIDVEAAEVGILRGGRKVLSHCVPLVIEIVSEEARAEAGRICPQYQFARLDRNNWLMSSRAA